MPWKFNPFSVTLDQTGSGGGGGAQYLDGEVATYNDLPLDGTAAADSAWLVRSASGTWLIGRKPAGIYIRTATAGVSRDADYTYAGIFPDVFSDANFTLYDDGDATKTAQFQLSGITTGTNRVVSLPDKNITLDDSGDSRTPTSHAASHAAAGSDPLAPSDIGAQSIFVTEDLGTITADVTLTAARAKIYLVNSQTSGLSINLPTTNIVAGDVVQIRFTSFNGQTLAVKRNGSFYSNSLRHTQQATYIAGSSAANSWEESGTNRTGAATIAVSQGGVIIGRPESGAGVCREVVIGSGSDQVAAGNHTHGNLTNDGKVGSTAGLPLKTGTAGVVEAGAFGGGAGEFAEGNHTHADLHTRSHAITSTSDHSAGAHKVFYSDGSGNIVELALGNSGEVLTSNGATSAPSFAAASGGDTVSIDTTAADVLTATSGAISADDGGTIDSADPFIKWDDTAGKLVYANPLSRPSGAFYVGLAPTTTAIGSGSVNIQPSRTAATQVASGTNCVAIGPNTTCGNSANVVIGVGCSASGSPDAVVIGNTSTAGANGSVVIGWSHNGASQRNCVVMGGQSLAASYRAEFVVPPFRSAYWGGQTTDATATVLNLDATATNRFTIAANTALAVDILLVARRSDTADKWMVARRFLGIRRDGSNNTSLIGSVQTLGTDQSDGSPTWSFTLTADDTNEALQLEVTGAASETVQWRATAIYRVV